MSAFAADFEVLPQAQSLKGKSNPILADVTHHTLCAFAALYLSDVKHQQCWAHLMRLQMKRYI
uniref:Uncharacterized protein n=1 Tax=Anguilla anguilla TaxID=7936 RepID=A0A0E9WRL4_ANGAN